MTNLTINLNAKLQPVDRHEFEDALQEVLEKFRIQARTTGGGTFQDLNGEVLNCDIGLDISDDSEEGLKKIINVMQIMLAPLGSNLIIHSTNDDSENKIIPFGVHQGLGLYLNIKNLDTNIQKSCDIDYVYEEIEKLLGSFEVGHIASTWQGDEYAFYLYGKSFDEMHKRIKPLLKEYPLCKNCKVVRIA